MARESKNNLSVNEYVKKCKALGSTYGLAAIKALLDVLDNPQDKIRVIHVAGTNGKGSTCEFLTNSLVACGYKVGTYTSPQVFDYFERFRINGQNIDKINYDRILGFIVAKACDADIQVSWFELETVLAYQLFYETSCDIAVIEAGCGGSLDATNVTKSPLAVCFTSIGLDHMAILGDTISEIAQNKAGLIKGGSIVASSPQVEDALSVIKEACDKSGATLYQCELKRVNRQVSAYDFCWDDYHFMLKLRGKYQYINSLTSFTLLWALQEEAKLDLDLDKCVKAISNTILAGRFEEIKKGIYIDGGHNEPAILSIKETLAADFTNTAFTFIIGVLQDKAYAKYLPLIADMAERIICISTSISGRELSAGDLADTVSSFYKGDIITCDSIEEAAKYACIYSKENTVLAFGSLSYLNEFKNAVLEVSEYDG